MSSLTPNQPESQGVIWVNPGPHGYWQADFTEAGDLTQQIESVWGSAILDTDYPNTTPIETVVRGLEGEYNYDVVEKTGIEA